MSRAGRVLAILGVLLGLGASGVVCIRVAQRGRFAVPYSTLGGGPEGARALYLLSDQLGGEPRRLVEDLSRLPRGAMLVVLGGCEVWGTEPSRYEQKVVRRFVERGGVLLVAGSRRFLSEDMGLGVRLEGGCGERSFFEALIHGKLGGGRSEGDAGPPADGGPPPFAEELAEAAEEAGEETTTYALPGDPRMDGIGLITLERPGRIVVGDDVDAQTLLTTWTPDVPPGTAAVDGGDAGVDGGPLAGPADGGVGDAGAGTVAEADGGAFAVSTLRRPPDSGPAAVTIQRGRGTVIVVSSASPFQNGALGWSEGGVLFDRLRRAYAPGSHVLFDEYHLGVGSHRSLMRYIRQVGGGPLVLQLGVIALLALWWLGVRFGAPQRPAPVPPAGTASYVGAIGRLYRRSGDAVAVLQILARRALGRVARFHHLPTADPAELSKALDERGRNVEADAVRALGAKERGEGSDVRSLAAGVRDLDRATRRATTDPESETT